MLLFLCVLAFELSQVRDDERYRAPPAPARLDPESRGGVPSDPLPVTSPHEPGNRVIRGETGGLLEGSEPNKFCSC